MPKVPQRFADVIRKEPELARAYTALGDAIQAAGPLDARSRALVKLGIAIGAWREGSVHSHARKALEAGLSPAELRHAALLSITTIGFPSAMGALSWVEDVAPGGRGKGPKRRKGKR